MPDTPVLLFCRSKNQLDVEKWHPRYLHVLVPKRDGSMDSEYSVADRRQRAMDAQIGTMQTDLENLSAKMTEIETNMEKKMDEMKSAQAAKLDEIKELLLRR